MANVSLWGANYPDVPALTVPKTGGGTETFWEYNYMGKNAEFVETLVDSEVALADTDFATWTPSTTAKIIVNTSDIKTFVADLTQYEYLIKWESSFVPVLNSGATKKAQVIWEGADQYQCIYKRPSNLANIESGNFNGNVCSTYYSVPFLRYYNTSGSATYTYAISYGIYPTLTASTFSSTTSNTPTVTVKSPVIYARCNNSYFATARASELDQTNSKFHLVGKLYRIVPVGAVRGMHTDFFDRYNAEHSA